MKALLLANDLSARSDRALQRAMRLAREHGAALTVVYAMDEDLPQKVSDRMTASAQDAIADQIAACRDHQPETIAIKVGYGRRHEVILREAERADADLLVLGIHGESHLEDMFQGATAERVLRYGQRPVLVVREPVSGPYRRSVVGIDLSACSIQAAALALSVTDTGDVYLVHAVHVPFEGFIHDPRIHRETAQARRAELHRVTQRLDEATQASGIELHEVIREGAVTEVLRREVRHREADLLVLGTHGRTGPARMIQGSVTETLLSHPPCDVLAARADAAGSGNQPG